MHDMITAAILAEALAKPRFHHRDDEQAFYLAFGREPLLSRIFGTVRKALRTGTSPCRL